MKFKVSKIARHNGESIEIQGLESLEGLADCAEGYIFPEPVAVKGTLTNISGRINMNVDIEVGYQTECARCLETISGNLALSINEVIVPVKQSGSGEDVDTEDYTFDDDWLVVDRAVVDAIATALPFTQLCDQDCKGLCPDCGINLNTQECDCFENKVNPDMAKLKNLLNNNDVLKDRG